MQTFPAVLVARRDLDQPSSRGWPLSGERWAVQHPGTPWVVVLDRQFKPVWRVGLPSAWGNLCAVADDLSLVACSLGLEVRLSDAAGGQIARFHLASRGTPRWDANCEFARDGRHLWAHAFIDGRDELWLIDLAALEVVDHRRLDTWAVGFTPFHHPDGQTIGLELPEGQDGSAIRWVRPVGGRIQLRCPPALTACWPTSILPAGNTSPRHMAWSPMSCCDTTSAMTASSPGCLWRSPCPARTSGRQGRVARGNLTPGLPRNGA